MNHSESTLGRNVSTLADIIKYNDMNPTKEGYNQTLLKMAEATNGLQNKTFLAIKNDVIHRSTMYLESIFDEYALDALVTPCFSNDTLNLYSYGAFAGYPSITVRTSFFYLIT